jgi:hypothetical protein
MQHLVTWSSAEFGEDLAYLSMLLVTWHTSWTLELQVLNFRDHVLYDARHRRMSRREFLRADRTIQILWKP